MLRRGAAKAGLSIPEGAATPARQVRVIVAEHLDIFVSNAGISKAAAMEDHTIEDFGKLYATNMRSGDAARCQIVLLRIEVHRP